MQAVDEVEAMGDEEALQDVLDALKRVGSVEFDWLTWLPAWLVGSL